MRGGELYVEFLSGITDPAGVEGCQEPLLRLLLGGGEPI